MKCLTISRSACPADMSWIMHIEVQKYVLPRSITVSDAMTLTDPTSVMIDLGHMVIVQPWPYGQDAAGGADVVVPTSGVEQ
jgi:hypothetical protein